MVLRMAPLLGAVTTFSLWIHPFPKLTLTFVSASLADEIATFCSTLAHVGAHDMHQL